MIIKKITSDRLAELNRFKGQSVEIIILPKLEGKNDRKNLTLLNELIGSCPDLPDGIEFQNELRKEWESK